MLPLAAVFAGALQSDLGTTRDTLIEELFEERTDKTAALAKEVQATMDDTRGPAGAIGWIPAGGSVLGALILAGLQQRVDEYRFQPR